MINKILEEMRNLRIGNDYKNYRSLCNILYEELRNEIFNKPKDKISSDIKNNIINIIKWIESELKHIGDMLEPALNDNHYNTFKILSQINNDLKRILERLYTINTDNINNIYKTMYVDYCVNVGQVSKVCIYFEDNFYIIKNNNITSNKKYINIIKDFAKQHNAKIYIDTAGFGIGIYDELKKDNDIRVESLKYNKLV